MIRKLFINNFRCLDGFELSLVNHPTGLLIGKNGSGKSTIGAVLEMLQKIARGNNRVGDLVSPDDFARGREDIPIRFSLDVEINGSTFQYELALEYPDGFHELRVFEEKLVADGEELLSRDRAQTRLLWASQGNEARFQMDWHTVALPVIQTQSENDPIAVFRTWLSRLLILSPVPSEIDGESSGDTLMPDKYCNEFGRWFTGLVAQSPRAYSEIAHVLSVWMPDFQEIRNPLSGKNSRSLSVVFYKDDLTYEIPFGALSDGEKIFFIAALVIAAQKVYGPLFCFWDEPDNFLALSEVGHFIVMLRRAMQDNGQFLATSHNPETIRKFSNENTYFLYRDTHLEPTRKKFLADMEIHGDLIDALIQNDV